MTQASNAPVTSVPYVLRVVLSRPAFWGCLLLGVVVGWIVPAQDTQPWLPKLIIGWNVGAGVFLLFSAWHIFGKPRSSVRVLSVLQNDGRQLVLGLALALLLMCLGCVVAELSQAREFSGPEHMAHLVLAGLTWMTAWAFAHVMFALHYAQASIYAQVQGAPPALTFTEGHSASYQDYLDVSVGLGVLGRSAKASLVSPAMRRVGLLQRVLAVVFNVLLLVLVVNVAAGLLS